MTTSSSAYAQYNGLAEKIVQTSKLFMKKADMDGCDPYIALLVYRNTAIPAQLLLTRNLCNKLPTSDEKLKARVVREKRAAASCQIQTAEGLQPRSITFLP